MFELEVPFLEKDHAKELGARWNAKTKKWFVPSGLDPKIFCKWWPVGVSIEQEVATGCSLAYFLNRVKNAIQQSFPDREWIIAEISEVAIHNGNYFITLVEYNELGHKEAQVNAKIWRDRAEALIQKFKEATGSELTAGIKVLVLADLSFHPQYGISLTIDDLDPSYTLGDMAAKINKIKETLQQEKIFDKNKQLTPPTEFTRVAVISPLQAAGLGDFMREADLLTKYNLCECVYFTATFQGKAAAQEIIQAINKVIEQHREHPFDAMVIIRGGGSVADLAWLNDLELARVICLCPLYVMVGVGHQRDYTILDDIAACRFDTPSKTIAHILQVIMHNAESAFNNFMECIKYAKQTLLIVENELSNIIDNIRQDIHYKIDHFAYELTTIWQLMIDNVQKKLIDAEQYIESLIREIICQGPEEILKKGFAIAADLQGKIINSCAVALANKMFKLTFHDGSLIVQNSKETNVND